VSTKARTSPQVCNRRSLLFAAFTIVALSLASACNGGASTPVGTPLGPGQDLARAEKLYHDGDFEEAMAIYSAVAQGGDGDQQRSALWRLAQIRYSRGAMGEAEQTLEALLALGPEPEREAQAYLLLGLARFVQGDDTGARDSLRRYIDTDGPAAPYARLPLAELAYHSGDFQAAIREVEAALALGLPPSANARARFSLARYQEAAGDSVSAVTTCGQLAHDAATSLDRGEAMWRLAELSRRLGDGKTYQESLYALATEYPWHPRALEALNQPQLSPRPILSTAERAVVLFHHRLNDQAEKAFRAFLEEQPGSEGQALAHYHLGVLAERAGDPEAALAEYEAASIALQESPAHELFGRASWERAFLLESLGWLEEAAAAYAALANASPLAEQAPEALFRAGLLRFRQGHMADAILFWGRYLNSASGPSAQARAHFWLAKAALATGDEASAARHLNSAAALVPWDYYGLRAKALAEDEALPQTPQADIQAPPLIWSTVEDWLRPWAGPEDSLVRQELFEGAAWRRSLELARTGLQMEAESEFAEIVERAAGTPWLLYRLARAFNEEGQVSMTAQAAARLAQAFPDPPRALLALAYPVEYLGLASEAAAESGFSPLLLLALVRQESFFDPGAVSSASALGLTQVIPSTAQEIAGQLKEPNFQNSDLLRPRVSLRFGAHYLGAQMDLFDGNLSAALAAYNGGPGNALRWREAAPDDPDLFLESIDFSETCQYVRLVLENYALYRYTYGLDDQPSLPLP